MCKSPYDSMEIEIPSNDIQFNNQLASTESPEPIPVQGAHNHCWILQFGVWANKPIIPSAHGPPAWYFQLVLSIGKGDHLRSIPINVMPAIGINFPDLN